MTDIASLQIRVDALEARNAERDLNNLGAAGRRTVQEVNSLSSASSSLSSALASARNAMVTIAPILGGIGFGLIAADVFKVNREMQSLRTSLETVTGSAASASAAFKQIQSFAASTPYSVQQVTEAFIKLGNYGLKPSQDALTSYGNTASAMGKSLDQMVEAVADAATGQFERLKEFGVKSAKEGDNVAFTFHGVTTTVKNSSEAIQEYLQKIGNSDFAGGMERQSKTIDGALSNLGDSWSNLMDNIITPSGEQMIASLISGTAAGINAIGNITEKMVNFGDTTASVGDYIESTWYLIRNTATDSISAIIGEFPMIGTVASATASFIGETFGAAWRIVVDLAKVAFNAVVGIVNGAGAALGTAAAGIVQVFSQAFGRIKDMASGLALGIESALSGDLSFSALSTAYKRETISFKQVNADVGQSFRDAFKIDYAGALGDKIKSGAKDIYSLRTMIDANNAALIHGTKAAKDHGDAHETAASKVGKHAGAHKGLSDAQKAAQQIEEDGKRLTESMRTPQEVYNDNIKKATELYKAHAISQDTLTRATAKYREELEKTNPVIQAAEQYRLAARDKNQIYNDELKKLSDVYHSPENTNGKLMSSDVFDKTESRLANTRDAEKIADQNKALSEYDALIKKINSSTSALGATNSAVFDGALGGINTLVGAFTEMTNVIIATTDAQKELFDKYGHLPIDTQGMGEREKYTLMLGKEGDYIKSNAKLDADKNKAALSGTRQIMGATSQMFAENTNGRKAFHAIEMTLGAIETAQNLANVAKNVAAAFSEGTANAAVAVTNQGKGDPYSAFFRIAAMAAIMAGMGFAVGGSSSSAVASTPAIDTKLQGTVLGDATKSSESVQNTYELLKDIHASEYRELRGINDGVTKLHDSIIAAVTGIYQRENLNLPTLPADSKGFGFMGMSFGSTKNEISQNRILGDAIKIGELLNGATMNLTHFYETKATTSYGFFTSVSNKGYTEQLSAETSTAIQNIFKAGADTLINSGKVFGLDVKNSVENLVLPKLDIDIKGLTADEAVKKFNSYISTTMDQLAETIFPDVGAFSRIGEAYLDTLGRLTVEVAIVKNSMEMVGLEFNATGADAMKFADALVGVNGNIKDLRGNFEDFFSKFFSSADQAKYISTSLSDTVKDMHLSLPATREGWKQLVQAELALGHEENAAKLLASTELADKHYSTIEDHNKSMEGWNQVFVQGQAIADAENRKIADGMSFLQNMAFGAGKTLDDLNLTLDQVSVGGSNVSKAFKDINGAMNTFVSLGEKINGTDWANNFRLGVASGQTTNDLAAFNKAAGTNFSKSDIDRFIAGGAQSGIAYSSLASSNPALGGLLDKVFSSYNTEKSAELAITNAANNATKDLTSAQKAATDALKSFSQSMGDWLNTMNTTQIGTPQQQFQSAQNNAINTYNSAIGGDQSAMSKLPSTLNTYFSGIDAAYGSSAYAAQLKQAAINLVTPLAHLPSSIGSIATSGIAAPVSATTSTPTTPVAIPVASGTQTVTVDNSQLIREVKSLRDEVAKLRAEQQKQVEAIITANYDANGKAAEHIVDGSLKAANTQIWASSNAPELV